ncbi:NACHT domain-containing protein [Streptococcus parasanguinis]|uniref:NACHT domain-containing protein n=1 Tax=Streptococcus parasanguinis TaxID=1318 RepID=UPI00352D34AC
MSIPVPFGDIIEKEVITNIPKIYQKLKQIYKDLQFKTEEELGVVYQNYLKFTYDKYSKVKTLLYKNEGKFIYDFYEHVYLSNSGLEKLETDNTEQIFNKSSNIILTGTGGIGKSMLVKHIFINQIQQATSIPIFIELKSLNDFEFLDNRLIDFIYQEIRNHHLDLEKQYFEVTLNAGRYTIIFDGLDEVNPSKRSWLDREIKEFVTLYNENRYVLSSRPSEEFIGWNQFIEYEISKMDKEQALALINKLNYDEKVKKRFYKELKGHLYDTHKSFASIPLLLTIMLMTYEAGASIPNNLTDFYNQAFYTLYQRHDASKSGYKRELKAKLTPEEFRNILAYIGLKTFFEGKVDFDRTTLDDIITKYCLKYNLELKTNDIVYDATHSACMMLQEGVSLKFSHRSFQEYFAAVGVNQLDDKLQKQILIRWSEADRNNIRSHRTFMNALLTIQKERTFKNLCIPIIESMDEKYRRMGDITERISTCFKYFICSKDSRENKLELGFLLTNEVHFYFSLQFLIFDNIGVDILSISNYESIEKLEASIVSNWEIDERKYYNQLPEVEKNLINKWVNGWYFSRHNYLKEWSIKFIEETTTQKRSLQNIIDSI